MSEEQLKAFLEKVKADTSLQEKLKTAADADAVVAIAKDVGLTISADNLKKAPSELANEELEKVANGQNSAPCILAGGALEYKWISDHIVLPVVSHKCAKEVISNIGKR